MPGLTVFLVLWLISPGYLSVDFTGGGTSFTLSSSTDEPKRHQCIHSIFGESVLPFEAKLPVLISPIGLLIFKIILQWLNQTTPMPGLCF